MYRLPIIYKLLRTIIKRGIINTGLQIVSVLTRPINVLNMPRHLQIEIITQCNLSCRICPRTIALEKANNEQMIKRWFEQIPIEAFQQIIYQLPSLQTISLHGLGEPLLHPDIFRMIRMAENKGIHVRFITNGTLLTQGVAQQLIKSKLWRLIVSIDGSTPETFELIRSGACFENVIENVKYLLALRNNSGKNFPKIDFNMVVCKLNAAEVIPVLEFADKLGIDSVILSSLKPLNSDQYNIMCDINTLKSIVNDAKNYVKNLGLKLYIRSQMLHSCKVKYNSRKRTFECLHPWLTTVITINGDVMPCCNINSPIYSMGNVFNENFSDIWNSPKYQHFRHEIKRKNQITEPCRTCPEF